MKLASHIMMSGPGQALRRAVRTACGAFAVVFFALCCHATTIRTTADMRLWQTVADRSALLAWQWEDNADAATLTFSNRVTRSCSTATFSRDPGAVRGSCAHPVTQPSVEAIVDVTLKQTASGVAVAQESAVLAYVSGAGGGPITVRAMAAPERELARLQAPRVYVVDPAWLGLEGESGYDIAWPQYLGLKIILR